MSFRVLLSSYACQPGEGSEAGIGWSWVFELAKAGVSVWVLTVPDGKETIEKFLIDNPRLDVHFVYIEHPPLGKLLRKFRARYSFNHLPAYFEWQNSAYKAAKKLQSAIDFDVVHHISLSSLHVGSKLWRLKAPFIFGPVGGGQTPPHGFRKYFARSWTFESARTLVARHLYRYVLNARSTVRGSKIVLVANRETEAAVQRLGARKIRLMTDIGFAGDRIAKYPRVSLAANEPLRILWVAKLNPRKGLLLALESISLVDKNTNWELTIVGDGPQGEMLPTWIQHFGLQENVKWLGFIPWADVQLHYDNADLLLFTSLRDTTGIQLLEAMGRGLPILALNHQGAATVVADDAGIKIPVTTPHETANNIARAIEMLAIDRRRLYKMGEAAIEVARSNTWDQKARDAIMIYQSLVSDV